MQFKMKEGRGEKSKGREGRERRNRVTQEQEGVKRQGLCALMPLSCVINENKFRAPISFSVLKNLGNYNIPHSHQLPILFSAGLGNLNTFQERSPITV